MKKLIIFLGLALLGLIGFVLVKTVLFKAPVNDLRVEKVQLHANPEWLQGALRYQTVSHKESMIDGAAFRGFHQYLDSVFPFFSKNLVKQTLNKYTLMYTLEGARPDLEPLVLLAHQDVVPYDPSTLSKWDSHPFSGDLKEGYIYGRGTLDNKGSLIAIVAALEGLLKKGFKPERTLILGFGHDEEIGGEEGARVIKELLRKKGIRAYAVIDEGGNLVADIVPGIKRPVALIGVAEKGYLSLQLVVNIAGGHSSMPEKRTAISVLNDAMYTLTQNPLAPRLCQPLKGFIEYVGPELPFVQKMAFANTWAFKPLIFNVYQQSAPGSALVQTTQAPTVFRAGVKDNVVPNRASAIVNYRLLPGDTPEGILKRAKELVDDTLVRIRIYEDVAIEASATSNYKSHAFKQLSACISANFEDVLVTHRDAGGSHH